MRGAIHTGFLFLVAIAALTAHTPARADLLVSPLRAVLTSDAPETAFRVSNQSDRIVTARVDWTDLAATRDGGYAPASPAQRAELSAAPYLVAAPADLTLDPGEAATIHVRLRGGAKLPHGERRSHLLIEATSGETPLRRTSLTGEPRLGGRVWFAGMRLDMVYGLSVPVMVRAGSGKVSAAIGETQITRNVDGGLELHVQLSRTGPFSAYGRLVATFTSEDGSRKTLATLDNISLYTDIPARDVVLPLMANSLPAGSLEVAYEGAGEYQGRTFAQRSYDLASPGSSSSGRPPNP